MRAVICSQWGPPESLQLGELPEPRPAAGEVLLCVDASALNFADLLMISRRSSSDRNCPLRPVSRPPGRCLRVAREWSICGRVTARWHSAVTTAGSPSGLPCRRRHACASLMTWISSGLPHYQLRIVWQLLRCRGAGSLRPGKGCWCWVLPVGSAWQPLSWVANLALK